MSDASRWRKALDDLNAPPNVLGWAEGQPGDFHDAWTRCDAPDVRVWLARAGGVSQTSVVAAVGQLLRQALQASALTVEQRAAVGGSLDTLFRFLEGQSPAKEVVAAASELSMARMDWDGAAKDLAFATDQLLRSSGDVNERDMPHDFMWLVDVAGALRVVVSGFKTEGFLDADEVDRYLAAVWQPDGHAPTSDHRQSLHDLAGLTDGQIVGRVYLLALERGPRASKTAATVARTVELENEVLNGGFGQYFVHRAIDAGTDAAAAYRSLGREDLAETVASAAKVASTLDRASRRGHDELSALNTTFFTQLQDDPTKARADFVRANAGAL